MMAKRVLSVSVFVCQFVCLSVCLSAQKLKNYRSENDANLCITFKWLIAVVDYRVKVRGVGLYDSCESSEHETVTMILVMNNEDMCYGTP